MPIQTWGDAAVAIEKEKADTKRHAAAIRIIGLIADREDDARVQRSISNSMGLGNCRSLSIIRQGRVSRGGGIAVMATGDVCVFIAGVNSSTSNNLLLSYCDVRSNNDKGILFYPAVDAVTSYITTLDALQDLGRKTYLYGHSAGAVVAEIVRRAGVDRGWNNIAETITYGSPKPGMNELWIGDGGGKHVRYMNDGDPVPSIPWAISEWIRSSDDIKAAAAQLHRVENLLQHRILTRLGKMEQTPDGVILAADGRQASANRNVSQPVESLYAAGQWALNADETRVHPHRVEEYHRRLLRREEQLRVEGEIADRKAAFPDVPITGRIELRTGSFGTESRVPRINRIPSQFAGMAGIRQTTMPVSTVGETSMMRIPPQYRPKHQKVGGQWCVVWMDELVGKFPTASKARTFSRGLTRAARTILSATDIAANALTSAWTAYLAKAADSTSGIKPNPNVI